MSKKKTAPEAGANKKMTRAERREIAKRIKLASNFTPEELDEEMKAHPNGQLARQVAVDVLWETFKENFVPPKQEDCQSSEEYGEELESFNRYVEHMHKVAGYWYTLGTQHSEFIEELLKAE